jgi:hypothetical protein
MLHEMKSAPSRGKGHVLLKVLTSYGAARLSPLLHENVEIVRSKVFLQGDYPG